MWLLLLPLVHFDRRRSRTLGLVCYLNLTSANLYSRCGVGVAALPRPALLLVGDGGKPFSRAILLVSLSHTHRIGLGEDALSPASDRHGRVIAHLSLLHHLLDL